MSVVLIVGSDEQLRLGIKWCDRVAEQMSLDAHILVAGKDRKVLQAQAEKIAASEPTESTRQVLTAVVPAEIKPVMRWIRSTDISALLMIYAADSCDLQRDIFERSPVQTMWIRSQSPPPDSAEHLFQAVRHSVPLASLVCEKTLGLIPEHVMFPPTDDSNQLSDNVRRNIESGHVHPEDFVLFGINSIHRNDPTYSAAWSLIDSVTDASIVLVREGESITQSFGSRIQRWTSTIAPTMQRDERLALATSLEEGSKPNLEFLGLMSAASMLAAFGLLQDSAAVIIGAMLIAPLMTPILGAGLALAHGNRPLFRSALLTITLGFVGAIGSSMLFGWLVTVFQQPDITPEMWARCRPSPLDYCVGLVGGTAAAYARTRSHLSSALAGAAIAAALVPPISTAGLQIAFGQWGTTDQGVAVTGPLLLVTVNVLTIMIGSSFVLWARGMRPDTNRPARDRWGPRMMMILMILAAIVMTGVIDAKHIFPLVR